MWYQILCIPYSSNLKILYVSQPDGLQAPLITIFGTQELGLGVNILVNVAVHPAILYSSAPGHKLLTSSPISEK